MAAPEFDRERPSFFYLRTESLSIVGSAIFLRFILCIAALSTDDR